VEPTQGPPAFYGAPRGILVREPGTFSEGRDSGREPLPFRVQVCIELRGGVFLILWFTGTPMAWTFHSTTHNAHPFTVLLPEDSCVEGEKSQRGPLIRTLVGFALVLAVLSVGCSDSGPGIITVDHTSFAVVSGAVVQGSSIPVPGLPVSIIRGRNNCQALDYMNSPVTFFMGTPRDTARVRIEVTGEPLGGQA
jgi:hypothetical protein